MNTAGAISRVVAVPAYLANVRRVLFPALLIGTERHEAYSSLQQKH